MAGQGAGRGGQAGARQEISPYVKDYEGTAFEGPNGIVYGHETGLLFFTDSGPLGETGISNPKGSVFVQVVIIKCRLPIFCNKIDSLYFAIK